MTQAKVALDEPVYHLKELQSIDISGKTGR
jgi:hypothetical protein